ncbi:MAG TPA: HD domain-containing phosphohydrolase [Candidatus Limnocylindrales bacterium]|nr:HD domain-containing phosphohydrolase [Candidatus Limnocylindrales bacterium]
MPGTPAPDGRPLVLIVEDDRASRTLLEHLLEREGYRVVTALDGQTALSAVDEHTPDLVLLDIGLPVLDGFEVTRQLRNDPRTLTLPIILLTGRTGLEDVVAGLDAGADDFLSKPFRHPELLARMRGALRLRQALVRMDAAHAAVAALANAVEAKDPLTERHCQRLANLAARVGAQAGLDLPTLEAVAYGALLHDVGKIGVPESILSKPGPLDSSEWDLMRRHPEIGERICRPLSASQRFAPIVRHHHERWDGHGYPDGLRGEAIPLGARIVALVDAFDAMTHDRPYRAALAAPVAIAELWREAGRQFDRALVPILVVELDRDDTRRSLDLPPSALLATG